MRTNKVDQAAFDALPKRYGARWLVELMASANYFGGFRGVVNVFEEPADAGRLPG